MNHFILLGIIYFAFISLGLPDSVLGVAWPTMRATLLQPIEAAGLITLVLTICSAISSFAKLKEFRGYFVVLAFVIAAIVTPPDVVSQLALAIPMIGLYEVGIWAAQIFIRHTQAPVDPDEVKS